MITLGALNDINHIRHGFFTRDGGVSTGLYASRNCGFGSNDDPVAVARNRALVMERLDLPADRLVTVHQIHGAEVAAVETPWAHPAAPKADGMVTNRPGIALGILTADCSPVLLADSKARVIGACHAGWKGAIGGVIEATVKRMVAMGARPGRIVAGVGPTIAQRSYEVGPEFPRPFLNADPANADFFAPSRREGHFMFDLVGFIARRVGACGIDLIHIFPGDTVAEEDRFFSYRRATLRGEPDYGRQISVIALQE